MEFDGPAYYAYQPDHPREMYHDPIPSPPMDLSTLVMGTRQASDAPHFHNSLNDNGTLLGQQPPLNYKSSTRTHPHIPIQQNFYPEATDQRQPQVHGYGGVPLDGSYHPSQRWYTDEVHQSHPLHSQQAFIPYPVANANSAGMMFIQTNSPYSPHGSYAQSPVPSSVPSPSGTWSTTYSPSVPSNAIPSRNDTLAPFSNADPTQKILFEPSVLHHSPRRYKRRRTINAQDDIDEELSSPPTPISSHFNPVQMNPVPLQVSAINVLKPIPQLHIAPHYQYENSFPPNYPTHVTPQHHSSPVYQNNVFLHAEVPSQKPALQHVPAAKELIKQIPAPSKSRTAQYQQRSCKTKDFLHLIKCFECANGKSPCRFKGLRKIIRDEGGNIVGITMGSSKDDNVCDQIEANLPGLSSWNIPMKMEHVRRMKRATAEALYPSVLKDYDFVRQAKDIIFRKRELDIRVTCDTCETTLAATCRLCVKCGREICHGCFQELEKPAPQPSTSAHAEEEVSPNDYKVRLSRCTKKGDEELRHAAINFKVVSRISLRSLRDTVEEMRRVLDQNPPTSNSQPPYQKPSLEDLGDSYDCFNSDSPLTQVADDFDDEIQQSARLAGLPHHQPPVFKDAELTEDVFQNLWAQGNPLIVTGQLSKFKISWTPEHFIEQYGDIRCKIVDCQNGGRTRQVRVKQFFETFGAYDGREGHWKLKDWPPSDDFKDQFPLLYEDFMNAVPAPNFVRRDGVLNIAAHYPQNAIIPDLGPKLYNAWASFEEGDTQGSTRLHMDMADAMNILTHAEPKEDGGEGGAIWDLFKAEDSDKLRKFLCRKFGLDENGGDPIHAQEYYLNREALEQLYEETGVTSYRWFQTAGQAVFIPAGCAHQVCNLSDCIKVAVDFVSPENIERCKTLTEEFRTQNIKTAWKEDVLQLQTMVWFAWKSCCAIEARLISEEADGAKTVS